MESFFSQFECEMNREYSIVIEDDGKVAYAYLFQKEELIGDVWLYNHMINPECVNWQNINEMPFMNPKKYLIKDCLVSPIRASKDIVIVWNLNGDILSKATIYLRGEAIAILGPFSKPGWSFLVKIDGPLANVIYNGNIENYDS